MCRDRRSAGEPQTRDEIGDTDPALAGIGDGNTDWSGGESDTSCFPGLQRWLRLADRSTGVRGGADCSGFAKRGRW